MKKPILYGANVHCAIDYGFVATLLFAPTLFKLKGSARTLSYIFGVNAGVLTALTDQPLALKKVIPARLHGQVDVPFVPILLLLPWVTGAFKQRNARLFFFSFFVPVFINFLLTDYERPE